MAQQGGQPEQIVEPEDPEYQIEEHVVFRRKQEVLGANLAKLLTQNVTDFSKIMDGTTYAYTSLLLRNMGISEITEIIEKYQHLRNIDLSQNILKQIPTITSLKYVTTLNLSRNIISNVSFLSRQSIFPYLKQVNLLGNKIQALPIIGSRNLRKANFNFNQIKSLQEFDGHNTLEILELRGNKIVSLNGLKKIEKLQKLYIADNQIQTLKHLAKLPNLTVIHARKNKIASLNDYPDLHSVKYLNLRENPIDKVEKLEGAKQSLRILNLLATPLEAELGENTKKQIWMLYRHYTKINKSQVTQEQRVQFDADYKELLATRQRQRLEREAAQKQAQEQQQDS